MKDKAKEKLFLLNVFNQATKSCCRFHLNLSRVTHTRAFKKFDIEVYTKVNPGTFLPLRIRNGKFTTRKKKMYIVQRETRVQNMSIFRIMMALRSVARTQRRKLTYHRSYFLNMVNCVNF